MYDLLSGLRIVEGASFVAAPLCGLTLVQLGADVIRFDPIGGGPDFKRWPLAPNGLSFYWEGLNKGKRSIALDVTKPEGRELAAALVTAKGANRGCFITNYPSAGFLSHAALRARRHDLITLRITGSSEGRNAVDYTVNCATGFPQMTGPTSSTEPVNHVLPAWDISAGLTGAVALLAALRDRERTGQGREVNVPLSNVAFSTLSALGNIGEVSVSGQDRPRFGNALYGSFGRDFKTSDGRRIMIVAITRGQWTGLIDALGLKSKIEGLEKQLDIDFTGNESARFIHREALFDLIEAAVGGLTFESLERSFEIHRLCWGTYQTVREAVETDARISLCNPMFEQLMHPSGEVYLAAGSPAIFSDLTRSPLRAAPRIGAHTNEILSEELGLSEPEIGRLHDQHVVAGV